MPTPDVNAGGYLESPMSSCPVQYLPCLPFLRSASNVPWRMTLRRATCHRARKHTSLSHKPSTTALTTLPLYRNGLSKATWHLNPAATSPNVQRDSSTCQFSVRVFMSSAFPRHATRNKPAYLTYLSESSDR